MSSCLLSRCRCDLKCVWWDVKPYSISQSVVTDGVAWCVCRSVGLAQSWAWTDQDAVSLVDSGGQRNHVLNGVHIPYANGQFWRRIRYLHGKWLAEITTSTILLQRNPGFGEKMDQLSAFQCWKVTKDDVGPTLSSVSVCNLVERRSYKLKGPDSEVSYPYSVLFTYFSSGEFCSVGISFLYRSSKEGALGHSQVGCSHSLSSLLYVATAPITEQLRVLCSIFFTAQLRYNPGQ